MGGMAEVYLALEKNPSGLSRLVVIKRILPELAADPRFVEMFATEARLAARVQHPNVVQIFEDGQIGKFPYLSMEYVPGSTLRQLMEAARDANCVLPVDVVVGLLVQAAAAVHAAHEVAEPGGPARGLIHRDVSPQNLMVTDDGHLKLLDFGIASEGNEILRPGLLEGKVNYMSPELLNQQPVDRRADLFALGVVGWELLTLTKPFDMGDQDRTMAAIVAGDIIHLRDVRLDVPEPVAEVIHRALATEPDSRQNSAAEFRAELLNAATSLGLRTDSDAIARIVRSLVGAKHAQNRAQIEEALAADTLPALESILVDDDAPALEMALDFTDEEPLDVVQTIPPSSVASPPEAVRAAPSPSFLSDFPWPLAALLGAAVVAAAWLTYTPAPSGSPLHIRLSPTLPADSLKAEHEGIRAYLERKLDRPVILEVAESYQAAADALVRGDVPIAILPSFTAESIAVNPGVHILVFKELDGTTSADGLFIAERDSGPTNPQDVKGKTLCFADRLSMTSWELPRAWLRTNGLDPDADVQWVNSGNHDQLLHDVLSGKCVGGGTWSGNLTTADERKIPAGRFRVLANTGGTAHDAVVAGSAADPTTAETIRAALLKFDPRRDLDALQSENSHISGFVPP